MLKGTIFQTKIQTIARWRKSANKEHWDEKNRNVRQRTLNVSHIDQLLYWATRFTFIITYGRLQDILRAQKALVVLLKLVLTQLCEKRVAQLVERLICPITSVDLFRSREAYGAYPERERYPLDQPCYRWEKTIRQRVQTALEQQSCSKGSNTNNGTKCKSPILTKLGE